MTDPSSADEAPQPGPTTTNQPQSDPTRTPIPTPTPEIESHRERAIAALQWVADGITPGQEPAAYENIRSIAKSQPVLFDVLIEKPWLDMRQVWAGNPSMADMLEFANKRHSQFASIKPEIYAMPFMDTLNAGDDLAVEYLVTVLNSDADGYALLLDLSGYEDGVPDGNNAVSNLLIDYIAVKAPDNPAPVNEIPWLLDDAERAEDLLQLALSSPAALSVLLEHYGTGEIPAALITAFVGLAGWHPPSAVRAAEMPFAETYDDVDVRIVDVLRQTARNDREDLEHVLTTYEARGGIRERDLLDLELISLELSEPELSAILADLPWVQDGFHYRPRDWVPRGSPNAAEPSEWNPYVPLFLIMESEERVLQTLIEGADRRNPADVSLLARKAWVQDGVNALEFEIIEQVLRVSSIYRLDDPSIAGMPFLDTPEYVDLDVLNTLAEIDRLYRDSEEAITIDAFAGGITDESASYLQLLALEADHAEAGGIVKASLWRDGRLAPEEEFVVRRLRDAAKYSEDVLEAVLRMQWARDGLNVHEVRVLDELRRLHDIDAAMDLLDMPFLEDVGPFEAPAIESLVTLHQSSSSIKIDFTGVYDYVIGHEALVGGVTDDSALVLSEMAPLVQGVARGLGSAQTGDAVAAAIDELLSGPGIFIEEGTARFSGGESTNVRIVTPEAISVDPGAIAAYVRAAEHHVNYLQAAPHADQFVTWHFTGWARFHATGEPIRDIDTTFMLDDWQAAGRIMNTLGKPLGNRWLKTGVDVALQVVHTGIQYPYGRTLEDISYCHGRNSIHTTFVIGNQDIIQCHGSAGISILLGLLDNLSERAFRDSLRITYAHARENSLRGNSLCAEGIGSLCSLWEGFVTQATPANAAIAIPIINKWYLGSEDGYRQ